MTQIDLALTERQQYWLEHIRACDLAGKPSVQCAKENGIEVSAMYSARKALAEKGTLPRPKPPRFQKAAIIWHCPAATRLAVRSCLWIRYACSMKPKLTRPLRVMTPLRST